MDASEHDDQGAYENWPHIVTACHEAGHAVFVYNLLPLAQLVGVEAPDPTGNDENGGLTEHRVQWEDRGPYYHAWHALAGRAAERIGARLYCDGTVLPPFDTDPRDHTSYDDYRVAWRMLRPGRAVPPPESMNDDDLLVREQDRVLRWLQDNWRQVHAIADELINVPKLSGPEVIAILSGLAPPAESRRFQRVAVRDPYRINRAYWSMPASRRRDLLKRARRSGLGGHTPYPAAASSGSAATSMPPRIASMRVCRCGVVLSMTSKRAA